MDRPKIYSSNTEHEEVDDNLSVILVDNDISRRLVASVETAVDVDNLAAEMDDMMVILAENNEDEHLYAG